MYSQVEHLLDDAADHVELALEGILICEVVARRR
jgi:hypothetical protein